MNLGLKGKFALVTGGSRGIGRATALSLADEGCNVAICARNADTVERTVGEIRSRGVRAVGVVADACKIEDIRNVMQKALAEFETLHVLVNNVGGIELPPAGVPIEETSEEVWLKTFTLNALAAVRFTTLALPSMRRQKWGRVITITSKQGREGGGKPWYTMAKSSEIAMMKSMAMSFELARDGITFNTVAPGAVLTEVGNWADFLKENPEKLQKRLNETLPLGRLGKPDEVASVITFLCSEQASLLSGACIPVDGAESKAF